jgi:hypothetical protein
MTTRPALPLEFDPDDYLCTWHVKGPDGAFLNLPGGLEVEPMRPPKGIVHGKIPIIGAPKGVYSFPQTVRAPVLTATLANGGEVLILDAQVTYWTNHGTVRGSAALLRKRSTLMPWESGDPTSIAKSTSAPTFERVRFQVGALDALMGVAPLKETSFPRDGHGEKKWAATANDAAAVDWASDGDALDGHYRGSARVTDAYAFSIRHGPVMTASPKAPQPLRQLLDDWVTPVQAIASIATGKSQPLTYLAVEIGDRHPTNVKRWQVYGSGIAQDPFDSDAEGIQKGRCALRCIADNVNLLDLVHQWQTLAADHHPLIETYAGMLHTQDQHPRSRLLLLLQSLEGMHGHETADAFDSASAAHAEKRKAVLQTIQSQVGEDDLKFIKRYLSKQPFRSLESALKSTFSELPIDLTDVVEGTRIVREVLSESPAGTSALGALAKVRNYLAHGVRGFDAYDLDEMVTPVDAVVRAHALRLLGCPDEVLVRVLDS